MPAFADDVIEQVLGLERELDGVKLDLDQLRVELLVEVCPHEHDRVVLLDRLHFVQVEVDADLSYKTRQLTCKRCNTFVE